VLEPEGLPPSRTPVSTSCFRTHSCRVWCTQTTYADNKLDLSSVTDCHERTTTDTYDANRNPIAVTASRAATWYRKY